jgi:hypothetical protein
LVRCNGRWPASQSVSWRQDEDKEGAEEAGGRRGGCCLRLLLARAPGSEATGASASSWHPAGVCTSIAPPPPTINTGTNFKNYFSHPPAQKVPGANLGESVVFGAWCCVACVAVRAEAPGSGRRRPGLARRRPGRCIAPPAATAPTLPLNNQPGRRPDRPGLAAMLALAGGGGPPQCLPCLRVYHWLAPAWACRPAGDPATKQADTAARQLARPGQARPAL